MYGTRLNAKWLTGRSPEARRVLPVQKEQSWAANGNHDGNWGELGRSEVPKKL